MDEFALGLTMETFTEILNAMIDMMTEDVLKYGENEAITRFVAHIEHHRKVVGPPEKLDATELVADHMWCAAERLMGAFINIGVWHE